MHRTKNRQSTASGSFKLSHQKQMSQSMAAELAAERKVERPGKAPQVAFTPEQLLDLREKGRPKQKTYLIPNDPELPNVDSDSEEEEWIRGIYASSNASTGCEEVDDKAEKKYAGKAKFQDTLEATSGKTPTSARSKGEKRRRQKSLRPMINAYIARSVGSEEMLANTGALKAKDTEWKKLWS